MCTTEMEDSCLKTEVHVHVHDQRVTSGKLCFVSLLYYNFPLLRQIVPVVEHNYIISG